MAHVACYRSVDDDWVRDEVGELLRDGAHMRGGRELPVGQHQSVHLAAAVLQHAA
jgi:hypothetical protein